MLLSKLIDTFSYQQLFQPVRRMRSVFLALSLVEVLRRHPLSRGSARTLDLSLSYIFIFPKFCCFTTGASISKAAKNPKGQIKQKPLVFKVK